MMNHEKEREMLALHKTIPLTYLRYKKLSAYFDGDFGMARKAGFQDLRAAGISNKRVEYHLAFRDSVDAEKEYEALQKCEGYIITPEDGKLPESLYQIESPPGILFARGEISAADFPAIAVVGSRKITAYGKQCVEHIVPKLAQNKLTIVSGLALGTDILAHQSCVNNNQKTIAVLGSAIDSIQPGSNKKWAEEQLQSGMLTIISEYAPGAKATRNNFVIRNRIVAGLSVATVVIQAGERSGTIATANLTMAMGRELFVVPSEIFDGAYRGSHELLKMGIAVPLMDADQIIERLGLEQNTQQNEAKKVLPAEPNEAYILSLYGAENKMHRDEILRNSQLQQDETMALLTIMELKGQLKSLGGGVLQRG